MANLTEDREKIILSTTSTPSLTSVSPSLGLTVPCRVCTRATPASSQYPAEQQILVCEACKKFHCRYRGKFQEEICTCGANVKDEKFCRLCRFKRCELAFAESKAALAAAKMAAAELKVKAHQEDKEKGKEEKINFIQLPCVVCGCSSSGFHFGVVSCEGCKGFFRRSMNERYKLTYKCKGDANLYGKLCPARSNCRKCRLQRCLDAGMSIKEVTIGRHTLRRRAEIEATVKKHFDQGSFLRHALTRRKRGCNIRKTISSCDSQTTPVDQASSAFTSEMTLHPPFSTTPNSQQPPKGCENIVGSSCLLSTCLSVKVEENNYDNSCSLLGINYPQHIDANFDDSLNGWNAWFIERSVEATARLADISTYRIVVEPTVSEQEFITARVLSDEFYAKCISEFMTALPGSTTISLSDRVVLFAQAFFPICAAQLSLGFDVERQLPNHFSLDREGAAWDVSARILPTIHFAVEDFLREAGNRLVTAIANLQEFSLFCALLLLNPDTPNLENVENVRNLRRRYNLALSHLFAKSSGVRSEQRLSEIYNLLPFFRRATLLFRDVFTEVNTNRAHDKAAWTPLFTQLQAHIVEVAKTGRQ